MQVLGILVVILILFLLWAGLQINNNKLDKIAILIIAILFIIDITRVRLEYFDKTGTEFNGLGSSQYGLRGDKLQVHPVPDCPYNCYSNCHNSGIIDYAY